MAKTKSTGTCAGCGAKAASSQMSRHLDACRAKASAPRGVRSVKHFHIAVKGADRPEYWMHLEVQAQATLEDLDGFLRRTWLECCGHLSAFEIGRQQYLPAEAAGDGENEAMDAALSHVLKPKMKFGYEYDFGSTTRLLLMVVAEHEGPAPVPKADPVRLLARNDPPEVACATCGKAADIVCPACEYEDGGWFCKVCAKKHARQCEGEETTLPVVNSPRVGVCCYVGPDAGLD